MRDAVSGASAFQGPTQYNSVPTRTVINFWESIVWAINQPPSAQKPSNIARMQERQRQSSVSLTHLPIVLFDLDNPKNRLEMGGNGSRRVSSASTSSSLPRTPSSAHGELNEYIWRDPDRLASLREAFSNSDYGSEDGHAISPTPISAISLSGATGILVRQDVERSGWNLEYKSPVRSLSVLSPSSECNGHRVTRSATTLSSAVRLWPRLPPQAHGQERLLEEELASFRDGYEDEEINSYESKTDEETSDAGGSQPPSESEDGALRRRRHIRRPSRAKQNLPRRLPPLPSSHTLIHSNSTAARYITVPFSNTADRTANNNNADAFSPSTPDYAGAGDLRKRSYTTGDLPANRVRPLPLPSPNQKSDNTRNSRRVAEVPPLRLTTLSLRSSPSEADAVLTKTPNRRFNPMGNAFIPPPMPQDAGTRIDWDLIGDILEVDGEMAELETPIATPRERTGKP